MMLPRVEHPVPETISLSTIVGLGAGIGMSVLVLAMLLKLPDDERDSWTRYGVAVGFLFGLGFYLLALATQLLCRQ